MKTVLIMLAVVVVLLIKLVYDERNLRKKQIERLKKEWGQIPEEKYTSEKFISLQSYYNFFKEENLDVDDITWNDIDMDEIYMCMNHTSSAVGEEYLYCLLRKLKFDWEDLQERNRLINFFMEHEQERIKLQMILSRVGKLRDISLYEYISRAQDMKAGKSGLHYFCAGSLIASVLLILTSEFTGLPIQAGILLAIAALIHNIFQYYKQKGRVDKYFNIFNYVLKLLAGTKKLSELEVPELQTYLDELKTEGLAFTKMKRGSRFVAGGNAVGGGLADIVLDYVRMLFHIDLIKFNSMVSELKKHSAELLHIYENVGLLDSMIAAASFRVWLGDYSVPVLVKSKKPFIRAQGLFHPLIDDPVRNSIEEERSVLITGSNASGKSTFIKTAAINAILSQTICTSTSSGYEASFFKVYSSMALTDNLMGQESYYIVEIKSLKRILDQLSDKIPMLCFVDEVLRGTNTLERIAASSRILHSLSGKNVICFAATHDIELTAILENHYTNYHFEEQIVDGQILFDYQLRSGRAVSRNAIRLLGIIGYDETIIEAATKAANDFLEKGIWNVLSK